MQDKELISAGIDLKDLMERLVNNSALVKIFVSRFVEDDTYYKLEAAFASKDADAAESAAHMLKGVCGNLSLTKLYSLFTEQVKLIRAGRFEQAEEMMTEISSAYITAIENMRLWLTK